MRHRPAPRRAWSSSRSRTSSALPTLVREKFTCRDCEKISQAPAAFHVIARGWAGPNLLSMILFEKFGQHQPLNRQAERYALEGVPISLSTMADAVGSSCSMLGPILRLVEAMFWRPNAFMEMTRPCQFWPKARLKLGGAGCMSGTTNPSAAKSPPATMVLLLP